MVESKLLISPMIKSNSKFRLLGYKKIVSSSIFELGIKIKNISHSPFPGGTIKKIRIESSIEHYINSSEKEFHIPPINPEEVILIWFEKTTLPKLSQAWFKLDIADCEDTITYQWDRGNKCPTKCLDGKNKWENLLIINDENILQQAITNLLLLMLTLVSVIKLFC
ncbi:hypothetical protein M0R72_10070 [Candidatus Pacearchaeota archaeon]|jgi:hypothetical protein|nr:hypothetical protein [Candidatus Pacearchaeota archaeon]